MNIRATNSFIERFQNNDEMMRLVEVCQYHLRDTKIDDATCDLVYEAMYNFKTAIADKYDLDMNKVCKKLEFINSIDESSSGSGIAIIGGKCDISVSPDLLPDSKYFEVARDIYRVLGAHEDLSRHTRDVSDFVIGRDDLDSPYSAMPKGYLYLDLRSSITEKTFNEAIFIDTMRESEISASRGFATERVEGQTFIFENPGHVRNISYECYGYLDDSMGGAVSFLRSSPTFMRDKFEAFDGSEHSNRMPGGRPTFYREAIDTLDKMHYHSDAKLAIEMESKWIKGELSQFKDSDFQMSDYLKVLSSIREHSARVSYETGHGDYFRFGKLSDMLAQYSVIVDLYGISGSNVKTELNINTRSQDCRDFIAAIQAIQSHGIDEENHFSNISYQRAANGVLKVQFGDQEIYAKTQELVNGQIIVRETIEPTFADKISQKIGELTRSRDENTIAEPLNIRAVSEVLEITGNGSRIEHGVHNLWDLTAARDELSNYGTVMQQVIVREAIDNTDFEQRDSNGSNILHVLAASNSPLDDLMIGELKASHLAAFVHMLNERDNDGRTPVDDMVENHGFEIKVDPEYGVVPQEFGHTLDNEFGHSGRELDDNDDEFGDGGAEFGDDPGGDIGID